MNAYLSFLGLESLGIKMSLKFNCISIVAWLLFYYLEKKLYNAIVKNQDYSPFGTRVLAYENTRYSSPPKELNTSRIALI